MRLAHFEILERIGHGGMGVVYRGRDTHLGRTAAIKVLPPTVGTDPERRSRFLREAQAAANLNHPNIATVYQFGTARTEDPELTGPGGPREVLFLAMELVEGEDLQAKLNRASFEPKEAFGLAVQIADGLAAAHAAGVVHRDLKPNNIRITHDGRVKLLDFGLAKVREGRLSPPSESVAQMGIQTSQGMLLGTPPYMAPEQLKGSEVDERCDLYALGVVLHQMIAGEAPYPVDNLLEYVKALANARRTPLTSLNTAVTRDQEAVVAKLLAQDPEKRYGSAEHAARDLRAVGGLSPTTPVTLRRLASIPNPRRWRRLLSGKAAATALVVLAGAVWLAWSWSSAGSSGDPGVTAVRSLSNLSLQEGLGSHARGLTELIYDHLADSQSLTVIGPTQTDPLSGEGYTAIRSKLEADTVIEGTLKGNENLIDVSIRVIETTRGHLIWKLTYRAETLEDLYKDGQDIAKDVGLMLRVWQKLGRVDTAALQDEGWQSMRDINFPADTEQAVRFFSFVLVQEPENAGAYAGRSLALQQEFESTRDPDRLELAEQDAIRAIEADPREVMGHIALARLFRSRGEYGKAIDQILSVSDPNLPSSQLLLELAIAYQLEGKSQAAVDALREAIEIRPGHWDYWNQLGTIQWKGLGDLEAAEKSFQEARELAPAEITWPLANLAGISYERGNFREAISLTEGLRPRSMQPELLSNVGTAYFAVGDFETARNHYELAIRGEPENPIYHRNLGDALQELGEVSQARLSFLRAADLLDSELRLNPNQPNKQAWLALYRAKSGDCSAATATAGSKGLEATGEPEIALDLAQAYALCRDLGASRRLVELALREGVAPARIRQIPELAPILGSD